MSKQKQIKMQTPKPGHALAERYPDTALLWDTELNGEISPCDVSYSSSFIAHWRCPEGHTWTKSVASQCNSKGTKARPFCHGKKLWPGFNDLETLRPLVAAQWHPELNGELKPSDVMPNSAKRVWWKYDLCGHEWQSTVAVRADKRKQSLGCPHCSSYLSTSFPEQALLYYLRRELNCEVHNRKVFHIEDNKVEVDLWIPSLMLGIEYDGVYWHAKRQSSIDKQALLKTLLDHCGYSSLPSSSRA